MSHPSDYDANGKPASGSPASAKKSFYADRDRKPTFPSPVWKSLPVHMTAARRWVLWRTEWVAKKDGGGGWTKVPYQANGWKASSTEPDEWTDLETAKAAYLRGGFAGIGYVFAPDAGETGVDLDDAIDPTTGELFPWAARIVATMPTYCELSPSGTGIKLYGVGSWDGEACGHKWPHETGEIEVYSQGRFFAVTGAAFGDDRDMADIQAGLDRLAVERLKQKVKEKPKASAPSAPPEPLDIDDAELIRRACAANDGGKFSRLWYGDKSGFKSDSEAVGGLVCKLAFWTQKDAARMDRLFRASGLMSEKWDSRRGKSTWGADEIASAISYVTEVYDPSGWRDDPQVEFDGVPVDTSAAEGQVKDAAGPDGEDGDPSGGEAESPGPPADPPAGAAGPHRQTAGWPEPIPLEATFDPPPFPVNDLSPWMRDYAVALAEEKQVPVDLPALLVLAAASGGLARKVVVSPRPGWEWEPVNLFVMCLLPPGDRKSQTFAAVFDPVMRLEKDLRAQEEPRVKEAESEFRVREKRIQHLEGKIAKEDDAGERARLGEELRAARRELDALPVPAMPLLRVIDDTPEMMTKELVLQGGRLMAASPEASTLENITKYGDEPNMDVFLCGHAGDDMQSGRISRGRDSIDRPALTLAFSPQPAVLALIGENPMMRNRGFPARWLYGLAASRVGYRKVRSEPVPAATRARYDTAMVNLWLTEYRDADRGTPHELTLTPEAQAELEAFEEWREPRLRPGEQLAMCSGWGNKANGLCARLAANLHVSDGISSGFACLATPVGVDAVRRAVRICREYAIPHALAAFGQMGESEAIGQARRVLRWIGRRHDPYAEFSRRDAFIGCRSAFESVSEIDPALDLLAQHFLIRPKSSGPARRGPGRPPSPDFEVNPAAEFTPRAQNAHNSQKSAPGPVAGNSASSASSAHRGYGHGIGGWRTVRGPRPDPDRYRVPVPPAAPADPPTETPNRPSPAAAWLVAALSAGPRPHADILATANEAGHTLAGAAFSLGVEVYLDPVTGVMMCRLPDGFDPSPYRCDAPTDWRSVMLAVLEEVDAAWTPTAVLVQRLNDRLPVKGPAQKAVAQFLSAKFNAGELERSGENARTYRWRMPQMGFEPDPPKDDPTDFPFGHNAPPGRLFDGDDQRLPD